MKEVSILNFRICEQSVVTFHLDVLSILNQRLGFIPRGFDIRELNGYKNVLTMSEEDVRQYKISKISNFVCADLNC